ncbi:DUF1272 domain-containing protein [Agarilytica rhodophyticola]|uniref:DUF1272 domain-containing protein n=1 Tax=Agarilytica rhodophyticola TaxID=1737490 RepID=UPI000B3496AA|nr:DUF1272 domain-containing protein [Agarilytica rhodophyticola]
MLELRPNCECCDIDLPPDSVNARICTYECTFCADCVEQVLKNVCPNCGGGFVPRPIRPKSPYREGTSLLNQPASQKRIITKYTRVEIQNFVDKIKDIPPKDR